ncbi:hypothetical protein [Paramicrobacterium agarici]|uniref:hypothetical protein n=1 Tax=Paramicrobacterium agarici TaxID=630514 RepID=UPI0011538E39|nr:hypothetical protein [Microbacterium agarici]TQO22729.1 hypothetical protein FB385_1568 [Microbacterium agarici]
MTISAEEAAHAPLVSDEQIEMRVSDLVGKAIKRQWWMLFLDENDVQLPHIVPVEGAPLVPDDAATQHSAEGMSAIMDELGAAQVILVWERPTGPTVAMPDRVWARSLAEAARRRGIRVRAQLISHSNGVRWLAPDDYLEHNPAS